MFSASPDATIRIWSVPNASCVQVVRAHESAVTGLSLHATGDYLLSSSDDQVLSQPGPKEVPKLRHPGGRRKHLTQLGPQNLERVFPLYREGMALPKVCPTRVPAFLRGHQNLGTYCLTGSVVSVFSVLGLL